MRLNAPIPALLALAVLYLFPVDSLARSTHHSAHKPTATSHQSHSGEPTHSVRKHTATASTHIHTQRTLPHHHTRHAVASSAVATATQPKLIPAHSPEKATSDDFVKAAETPAQRPGPPPAPVAIHGTSRPEELDETPLPSSSRKLASVSKPVPVVGVVRRSSPRPQLPSVEEAVENPVILPTLYNKRGRLIVPPPLAGVFTKFSSIRIRSLTTKASIASGTTKIFWRCAANVCWFRSPPATPSRSTIAFPPTAATAAPGLRSFSPPWRALTMLIFTLRCRSTPPSAPLNSNSIWCTSTAVAYIMLYHNVISLVHYIPQKVVLTQECGRQLVKRIGTLDMRAMPTSLEYLDPASFSMTRLLRMSNRYYTIFTTPYQ